MSKTIIYRNGQPIRVPTDLVSQKIKDGFSLNKPSQSGNMIVQPSPNLLKFLLFINTASQTQLESLDGVGPGTAAKILEAREKSPIESLDSLKKMGSADWQKLAREYQ